MRPTSTCPPWPRPPRMTTPRKRRSGKQKQKQQQLGKTNVDRLEVMADFQTFQRFDKFNSKYSLKSKPCVASSLHRQPRAACRDLPEGTKRLEDNGTTFAEHRSPTARSPTSGSSSAAGSSASGPPTSAPAASRRSSRATTASCPTTQWQIQIPRIWSIVGQHGRPQADADASSRPPTFADCLANIFVLLFMASWRRGAP